MVKEQLLNTTGAATYMRCTENWVHKLVYSGRLKAHVYDANGVLVEREPHIPRQGQGLYFYKRDIDTYKKGSRRRGRPHGSKDKTKRVLKTDENTLENT